MELPEVFDVLGDPGDPVRHLFRVEGIIVWLRGASCRLDNKPHAGRFGTWRRRSFLLPHLFVPLDVWMCLPEASVVRFDRTRLTGEVEDHGG